ncbi:sigma-54-dependent Fis family transcriptional regulator [Burkholderia guangdongensis]|uniref:sigma-54-dependent Fis family transcriptional regulator n=1 Tax=Burkholderia guangdongensis TaxID=1792500 RepID=UPI001FE3E460|nr:sigma-54-dependent Fis family transcriptional regulator [Burkholderia guangdongensis]
MLAGAPGGEHAEFVYACLDGSTPAQVEPRILTSWRRSIHTHSLDPERLDPPRVLSGPDLRSHRESTDRFRLFARGPMERLATQILDAGYIVLLADASGIAIDFIGNPVLDKELRRNGLYLGSCWSESEEGTNGVGTCIVEKTAITVHHAEHFRQTNIALSCSAVPILGPTGEVLGVLDASALSSPDDRRSQHLVLQLVKGAVTAIENAHFLDRFRHDWVVRIGSYGEWTGLAADLTDDGLLALDGTGRIVGANRAAFAALGPQTATGRLLDGMLEEIVDTRLEDLLSQSFHRADVAVPMRTLAGGKRFFVTVRSPRERPAAVRAAVTGAAGVTGVVAPGRATAGSSSFALTELAGADPTMLRNVHQVTRVLGLPIAVMLQGETGTGKEAFAKAMHEASDRCQGPFVALNCAALPETLIESELFGYKEGAFTGARSKGMRGKLLQSDGGTLFLDEIGDMPIQLQTRLLRVLEEREVVPLGADKAVPVDFRLVCATHRNLTDLVRAGEFREDLYYRLNGLKLFLPALRERADKADLIRKVRVAEAVDMGRGTVGFSDDAWEVLMRYAWPGNIRELRNCMRSALALCDGGVIEPEDLPPDILSARGARDGATKPAAEMALPPAARLQPTVPSAGYADPSPEAQALIGALRAHYWNVTRAAASLGICRATLYRKMERFGIVPPNRAE